MKKNRLENRFFLAASILIAAIITYVTIVFVQKVFDGSISFHSSTSVDACDSSKNSFSPLPKIPEFQWHGTGIITLWFDDAWSSQFTAAVPSMEKVGFKGAISVALKFICKPHFMSWNQLHELQQIGWETTSHSVTHNCNLSYYNPQTIEKELLESKQTIEAHGLRADHFVMPCGYGRSAIMEYAAGRPYVSIIDVTPKYYASYRTTDGEKINPLPVIDKYDLKAFEPRNTTSELIIKQLVEMTKNKKGWLILVFHQIDNSNQTFAVTPTQFNKILTIVKDSDLPVILPSQALLIGYNPLSPSGQKFSTILS